MIVFYETRHYKHSDGTGKQAIVFLGFFCMVQNAIHSLFICSCCPHQPICLVTTLRDAHGVEWGGGGHRTCDPLKTVTALGEMRDVIQTLLLGNSAAGKLSLRQVSLEIWPEQ